MTTSNAKIVYKPRWYFGGLASTAAVIFTHPLDSIKVLMQTQQQKLSMLQITKKTVQQNGVISLYNGLSASILRQLTYSMVRFGIYEAGKSYINTDKLIGKIALAGIAGAIGGFIGTPADMVNVRMQNDAKLAAENRRNYKHVIDGLIQVYRSEGIRGWYSAAIPTSIRGGLVTVGQLAFYDQVKTILLKTPYFKDDVRTHLTASLSAAAVATLMTQPFDVVKTRKMNAKPGEFSGVWAVVLHTAKLGPLEFFTGLLPSFLRIGPHTVLLFVFFEQLRLNFGIERTITEEPKKKNHI